MCNLRTIGRGPHAADVGHLVHLKPEPIEEWKTDWVSRQDQMIAPQEETATKATRDEGPPKITFDDDKNTSLHFAAARGDVGEVLKLVDAGHKVDIENYLGWTPLMMGTRNGHVEVIRLLLERRADATRKNKFGGNIFLMSVATGNLDIVHAILEHLLCGGVSKQSMENIFSPLSISILFNQENIFTYLLGKGFNENAITPITGLTPLMFAALSENQSFISVLLSKAVNQSIKNINGETAQDILQRNRGVIYQQETAKPCLQHPQIPKVVVFSPQPVYHVLPNQTAPPPPQPAHVHRKSSNLATPNYCYTPNISPISPIMFFPPDFSPSQMMASPMSPQIPFISDAYTQMNATILSPMVTFNYPSPCDPVQYHTDRFFPYFGYPGNRTPVL